MADISRPEILFDPFNEHGGTRIGAEIKDFPVAAPEIDASADQEAIFTDQVFDQDASFEEQADEPTTSTPEDEVVTTPGRRKAKIAAIAIAGISLWILVNGPRNAEHNIRGNDNPPAEYDEHAPYTITVPGDAEAPK